MRVLVALDGRICGRLCRDCRSSGIVRLCGLYRSSCAVRRLVGIITLRSELSVQTICRKKLKHRDIQISEEILFKFPRLGHVVEKLVTRVRGQWRIEKDKGKVRTENRMIQKRKVGTRGGKCEEGRAEQLGPWEVTLT